VRISFAWVFSPLCHCVNSTSSEEIRKNHELATCFVYIDKFNARLLQKKYLWRYLELIKLIMNPCYVCLHLTKMNKPLCVNKLDLLEPRLSLRLFVLPLPLGPIYC